MIFKVKIDSYDEAFDTIETDNIILVEDNYVSAVRCLSDYYGDDYIDKLSIEPIEAGSFIKIDNQEQFEKITNQIKSEAIW